MFVQLLNTSLSICVSGDEADLPRLEAAGVRLLEISGEQISRWEAELLQERLQELLCSATDEDDDDAKAQVQNESAHDRSGCKERCDMTSPSCVWFPQDAEQLKRLRDFLHANRDLAERFSAELEAIDSPEAWENETNIAKFL